MSRHHGPLAASILGMALAACGTSPPEPGPVPAKAPSTIDTGTPTRSNVALAREVRTYREEARALWTDRD